MRDLGALELGAALERGDADPVAIVEGALRRAAADDLHATFITLTAERALAEARASRARQRDGRRRGPLDGVPVAWKDLFDIAGTPTTAGSAAYAGAPAAMRDAAAVARLTAAGMACLGKTNLSELAFSGLGLNDHFGTPRNPHGRDRARIAGGSSSGAAVAVAAGVCPCAVGTDTSGSVRVPAALTGTVGYKGSADRFDTAGMRPLAPTLDSLGIVARSVADVVAVDRALRGLPVAIPPVPADLRGMRIVVPGGALGEEGEPAVLAGFARFLAAAGDAGATVEHRAIASLERVQELVGRHGHLVVAEAYAVHRELLESPAAELLEPRIRARLLTGAAITADDRAALLRGRAELQRELAAEVGAAIVAFPTTRETAPAIAPLAADDAAHAEANARILRNTIRGSFLDMPGISLPTGVDRLQLPTGVLLSVPSGGDDALLAAALAVEAAIDPR